MDDLRLARLHRELAPGLSGCLESLDLAISGGHLEPMLLKQAKTLRLFQPDLVVANFSNNDSKEKLAESLPRLIGLASEMQSRLVLIEEANDFEDRGNRAHLVENHELLRSLGQKHQVPVLPLHGYLSRSEIAQSGALWWDYVHLTSYGQEVAARWLAPHLLRALKVHYEVHQ